MGKQKILRPMPNDRRAAVYRRTNGQETFRPTAAQARRIRKHDRRSNG
jgi:hypothetical protein